MAAAATGGAVGRAGATTARITINYKSRCYWQARTSIIYVERSRLAGIVLARRSQQAGMGLGAPQFRNTAGGKMFAVQHIKTRAVKSLRQVSCVLGVPKLSTQNSEVMVSACASNIDEITRPG